MRVPELRKKIIVNFSASGILLAICAIIIAFHFYENGLNEQNLERINSETSQIQNQISDTQNKESEIKKYNEIWQKLTVGQKNTDGIRMDDLNGKLDLIADKYSIFSHDVKVTLPDIMHGGIFETKSVNVLFTTVNLTFTAANDVKALLFINELIQSLPGYPVITNLEIKKTKSYSDQDLVDISTGKGSGAISGKVDFYWYAYKAINPAINTNSAGGEDALKNM